MSKFTKVFLRTGIILICLMLVFIMAESGVHDFLTTEYEYNGKSDISWLFIGDSITYGDKNNEISYVDYIGKMTGYEVINTGINGYTTEMIIDCYDTINRDADIVTVFLGANDWMVDTPIGTPDDSEQGTFCGNTNVLLNLVKETHPDSDIFLLTPIPREIIPCDFISFSGSINNNGDTAEDFAQAAKSCAEKNNIHVIDLYSNSKITPNNLDKYTSDLTHPNNRGHFLIAWEVRKQVIKVRKEAA